MQRTARSGGQGHRQRSQQVDLAPRIARPQPLQHRQLLQHPLADRQPDVLEPGIVEPARQPLGGAGQRRDQPGDVGVDPGQRGDRVGGRQPGQGGQSAAEVEVDAQQVGQTHPRAEDLAQRLFQHLEGQGARRPRGRGGVGEVEEQPHLVAPAARRADVRGHGGPEVIAALRIAGQAAAGVGEVLLGQVGEIALLAVGQHTVDRPLDQLLEVADDLMDADAAGLGFRHGDLLHRVLQLDARGLQLLDQVGPVQQFERRRPVADQPAFQQPADHFPGMDVVEVGGADAGRPAVLHRRLALGDLHLALGQDADALVLARVGVAGLLGDLDADVLAALQHLLGGGQRLRTVFRRQFEPESGSAGAPCEHLEVYLRMIHVPATFGRICCAQPLTSR